MTIPKHAGLSRLAEAARLDGEQILHSYPVKRKGGRRRLLPNQAGIEWLESDANNFDSDTEIDEWDHRQGKPDGIRYYAAAAAINRTYSRPIFQILPRDAFHTAPQEVLGASACCYDFHRSWKCEEHPEVPYDHGRQLWLNPRQLRLDERRAESERVARQIEDTGNAFASDSYCSCGCEAGQVWTRPESLSPETINTDGLLNATDVRPILGTPNRQLTVEAETEQSRGSGITEVFTIEVERPGGQ